MKRVVLALVVAAAVTGAALAGPQDNSAVTVGDFALKVSKALGYDVRDNEAAIRTLKTQGIDLGLDMSAKVTERMASDVLGSLGVKVTTTNPAGAISNGKLDSLVTALALDSLSTITPADLPPPPTSCRDIRNKSGKLDTGKCKKCCKLAVMDPNCQKTKSGKCKNKSTIDGFKINKICDRFCKTGEFPSPSEPQF